MSVKYDHLLDGADQYEFVTQLILNNMNKGTLAIGMDLDGTLVHATPGDHVNVAQDVILENLLNNLNYATYGHTFVLTGRPTEFERRIFPARDFFIGTEHGSVISYDSGDAPRSRIGNAGQIMHLRNIFAAAIANDPVLKGVEIEDHKSVTMTLGFTHIINPENTKTISDEKKAQMNMIRDHIVVKANELVAQLPAGPTEHDNIIVKDTVTPTNAVVEIMPAGACKSKSLDFLRDSNILQRHFTVFGGDSGGDREVMEKVHSEGGVCLGVGEKAPKCSHIVFKEPQHLRAYLSQFLDSEMIQERIATQRAQPRALAL